MKLDLAQQRVCVTGGAGFVGKYVVDILLERGVNQILVPRRADYDLTVESDVASLYRDFRPNVVIHLAAVVGGIGANRSHPGKFFYDNLIMGVNLIEQARQQGIRKFVHVGTVCSYPKHCSVPFVEDDLWNGFPEETNAPYGIAKKALIVMLESYRKQYGLQSTVVLPTNLYGPRDNFDEASSHVIPAIIRKMEAARQRRETRITAWGTGNASREFLFVTDAAEAIVRAAELVDTPNPINLGTDSELTIRELTNLIASLSDFDGTIDWNDSYPDGQPRRRLNTSRATQLLGWRASTTLEAGLKETIAWYRASLPANHV